MLKNISNLGTVLNKVEQKSISGGLSDFLCVAICGPGDGNTPIYDNPHDSPFPETVGCICGS
ncbi:hypothetical protein ACFO3O_04545 [Dokdonia ponticola]|uniref:Bacteriocin n=1 Tax=Dokdonia ponticola TaxID=2041041 RepID=A0ABV9HTM5_9FLAO